MGRGEAGRAAGREAAWALAAMAGWACLWWPLLTGAGRPFVVDLTRFALPAKEFLAAALADGRLPLWTPWFSAGQPWLADLANQAFYPLNVVYLGVRWTGAAPGAALAAFLLAHSLLALVAMRLLLRELGAGRDIAWLLGLAYAASGVGVSATDNVNYLPALAWLPLALAALCRLLDGGPRPRPAAVLALAFAMLLLCGDPLDAGLLVAAVALLAAHAAWRARRRAAACLAVPAAVLAALGLGVALAGVQVLPTLDLLSQVEAGRSLDPAMAQRWSLPPARLLEFVAPFPFGTKYPFVETLRPGLYPDMGMAWFASLHLGLPLLALAATGLLLRPAVSLPLLVLLLLATALALGRHAPFFEWARASLPLLDSQRYPEKLALWMTLLLVMLAAAGSVPLARRLARLRAADPRRDLLWRLLASVVIVLAVYGLLVKLPTDLLAPGVPALPSLYWSGRLPGDDAVWLQGALVHAAAVAALLVAFLWTARRWPAGAVRLLLAGAALDLLWLHAGHMPSMPAALADRAPPPAVVAALELSPGTRVLVDGNPLRYGRVAAQAPMARVLAHYPDERSAMADGAQWMRAALLDRAHLVPDTSMLAGVPVLSPGLAPLVPAAQVERVRNAADPATLAAAAVGHVLARGASAALWRSLGLEPAWSDADTGVVALRVPGRAPMATLDGPGSVALERPRPERIRVAVATGEQTRLVVRESWHPGWKATLDGQALGTPAPGPQAMLALVVPAGRHVVEFHYEERLLPAGAALSGAALALLGWLLAGAPRPRRRRGLPVHGA